MVRTSPETIRLRGGALCIDFANSVDWDADDGYVAPELTDVLVDGAWVGRWARRVGIPGRGRIGGPEVERLRELRLALHLAFGAIARGGAPRVSDLELVRLTASEGTRSASLRRDGEAFAPVWPGRDERRVRFAVAADAFSLLGDPERLRRLRRCPGTNCGWLFLDTSGRRRWCSMSSCGSREKMRRAYRRRRARERHLS